MGKLQKIQMVAQKAFEEFYLDKLTVTTHEMAFDEVTSTKKPKEFKFYEDIPCKLDFKSESTPEKEGYNHSLTTQYMLYVSPSVIIKEGSTIEVVTENGMYYKFGLSGSVQAYPTHNEYPLIEKKKAI